MCVPGLNRTCDLWLTENEDLSNVEDGHGTDHYSEFR
jgi:hypothetical protein